MKINLAAVCLRSCLSLGLLRRLLPFGRRQRLFVMHDNALREQKPEKLQDLEKGVRWVGQGLVTRALV